MEPVSSHSALGYLIRVAVVLLGWVAFSIVLTVLVDPYRTYGTPTLSGWTELKPRIYKQSGIAKTSQQARGTKDAAARQFARGNWVRSG